MVHFTYNNSEETRLKEIARLREKTLHDEASALGNAKEEGVAIGLAKGLAIGMAKGEAIGLAKGKSETKSAIIANMKAMGMTDEQIKALLPE